MKKVAKRLEIWYNLYSLRKRKEINYMQPEFLKRIKIKKAPENPADRLKKEDIKKAPENPADKLNRKDIFGEER